MKINHKNFFNKRYMGIDPVWDMPNSVCGYIWRFVVRTIVYLIILQFIVSPFVWFITQKARLVLEIDEMAALSPYMKLCHVMTVTEIFVICTIPLLFLICYTLSKIRFSNICGKIELKDND